MDNHLEQLEQVEQDIRDLEKKRNQLFIDFINSKKELIQETRAKITEFTDGCPTTLELKYDPETGEPKFHIYWEFVKEYPDDKDVVGEAMGLEDRLDKAFVLDFMDKTNDKILVSMIFHDLQNTDPDYWPLEK